MRINTIKEILAKYNLQGWVASDFELNSQLWNNVQSYMLACDYGIAIFTNDIQRNEKREENVYNPNVSIELGYMLSRGKNVLILKDHKLKKLPSDMLGSLYKNFDLENPDTSLPQVLEKWIGDIDV